MAVTPQTNLFLIKSPLELDNKNQLTFASKQAQHTYFSTFPHLEIDNISYQRKDNVIRYRGHIDSLMEYNYCMYQNENYSNKWFYAYITNMQYENDNCTLIYIQTDVFQTWQFDLVYKQSFIEREHMAVADDIAGANLIPEGLELGELKVSGTADLNLLKPLFIIAYGRNPYTDGFTTQQPAQAIQGTVCNGIPSGMFYCVCNDRSVNAVIETINSAGFGDSIVSVFAVPVGALVGLHNWTLSDLLRDVDITWWIMENFTANPQFVDLISRPNTLDGYTPKNQKLRTYPYMYVGYNPQNRW